MWAVATTETFDEWFAELTKVAHSEIIAKVNLSTDMAKSFDALVKRSTNQRARDRASARTRELLAELPVGELRQLAGKSQRELATILGIKQPSLSKLENQSDMQISTLQKIVEALGGELDLVARFPKGAVRLGQFTRTSKRSKRLTAAAAELHLF
jgi:hypothetical protein